MDFEGLEKLASLYLEAASKNDYMREYMKNRYHAKRQALIDELGGKCISCGTKAGPFHIDHKDASKKTMRAADIHSASDKKVQEEKKNFQLMCAPCHKEKTHNAWDYSTPKSKHGTYWHYRKYKCRCDKCSKAYKDALKSWRKPKSQDD